YPRPSTWPITSTGMRMRAIVRANASRHCAADSRSTRPESSAATNTPVPAADSQLMVKRATSGLALAGATGGMRWTRLCREGISHAGSDSVPAKAPPRSRVLNLTEENRLLSDFLNSGSPQIAQQAMRIAHGNQAWSVSPTVYLYFQSLSRAAA